MDDIGGVWRTVGGRRIFIKDGQDLATAMRESGKFESSKTNEYKNLLKKMENYKAEKERLYSEYKEKEAGVSNFQELYRERDKKLNQLNQKYDYSQIRRKIEMLERENYNNTSNNIKESLMKQYTKDYEFKSEVLREKLKENIYYIAKNGEEYQDIQKQNKMLSKALIALDKVNATNDFEISESPYSFSIYSIPKGTTVDWGSKPENSYRLSDHWNFESQGSIHCELSATKDYTQKLILAKYNGTNYDIVEEFK